MCFEQKKKLKCLNGHKLAYTIQNIPEDVPKSDMKAGGRLFFERIQCGLYKPAAQHTESVSVIIIAVQWWF